MTSSLREWRSQSQDSLDDENVNSGSNGQPDPSDPDTTQSDMRSRWGGNRDPSKDAPTTVLPDNTMGATSLDLVVNRLFTMGSITLDLVTTGPGRWRRGDMGAGA